MEGFSYPAYSTVLVTEHTTVYATDASKTASTHPAASATNVASTMTDGSSAVTLLPTPTSSTTTDVSPNITHLSTSATPTMTDSHSSVILSSTSTSLQTTPLVSSATAIQPVSTSSPEATSSIPKTDDNFAYAVLAFIILLAVLLIVMLAVMLCLRSKGKCPNCRSMQKKLENWESGKLKPITPAMVKDREAQNRSSSHSNAPSELDVELGGVHETDHACPAEQEESKKASTWQKVKSKVLRDEKPSDTAQNPYVETEANRPFTTVESDIAHNYPYYSPRVSLDAPRVEYESSTHLKLPATYRLSGSSFYSPPTGNQRANGRSSHVFADVPISEPKRYSANENQEITLAQDALHSEEYRRAEMIMKRETARDSVIHHATSIVTLVDQQLNVARHPPLYPEFRGEQPGEPYEMAEWRKRGDRGSGLDDDLYSK